MTLMLNNIIGWGVIVVKLKLEKCMQERGISRYELSKRTGTYYQIIDSYYKNKVVRYDSDLLNRICQALDCDISDIIEYTKD